MLLVSVQQDNLRGHAGRWAYVITGDDYHLYVSTYRYHSAESAQQAGERDAEATAKQWEGEQ